MMRPSSLVIGSPGHSSRKPQFSKKGVASMPATISGWPMIDSADTAAGWVCTMHRTAGFAR